MSGLGGRLGYFLAGAAAAVVAMLLLDSAWASSLRYDYPTVFVRTEEVEAREPDIENPTIIERVVYRTIEPAQVAIATGGGVPTVESFCRPVTVATTDTVEVRDTVFLVRSGRVEEPSVFTPWRPLLFRATGPTNAGDLVEFTFEPRGSFAFEASGDSLLVRRGRFAVVRDAWEVGSQAFTILWAVAELVR